MARNNIQNSSEKQAGVRAISRYGECEAKFCSRILYRFDGRALVLAVFQRRDIEQALRYRIRYILEIVHLTVDKWWYRRHVIHLRNPSNGNLYVRYLYWNDGELNRNYNWLDNDWNRQNPSASVANLFISLPQLFTGRVLFY